MRLILPLLLLIGCGGFQATDVTYPLHSGTVEACRQLKLRAVERAETREEAVERVAKIEERCTTAYFGIEIAEGLLEEVEQ